jgi:hypothetical protein
MPVSMARARRAGLSCLRTPFLNGVTLSKED